ncbi:hypothetical protein N9196_02805, partial [Akkermansiaceae bacterium]|nr:hypothetical protein [Akkermansiaceae bacterium]
LFTGIWMFHSISDQKNESSPPLSNQSSRYDRYQTLDVPEDTLYDLPPLTVAKNFALSDSVRERLKWASKPEEITSRLPEYSGVFRASSRTPRVQHSLPFPDHP